MLNLIIGIKWDHSQVAVINDSQDIGKKLRLCQCLLKMLPKSWQRDGREQDEAP